MIRKIQHLHRFLQSCQLPIDLVVLYFYLGICELHPMWKIQQKVIKDRSRAYEQSLKVLADKVLVLADSVLLSPSLSTSDHLHQKGQKLSQQNFLIPKIQRGR